MLLDDGVKILPTTSVPLKTPPDGEAVRLILASLEQEFGVDVIDMLDALKIFTSSKAVSPPQEFP